MQMHHPEEKTIEELVVHSLFMCVFKLDSGLRYQRKQWEPNIVKKKWSLGKGKGRDRNGYNLHTQKRRIRFAEQRSAPTKCIAFFNDATWDCLFNLKNILQKKRCIL